MKNYLKIIKAPRKLWFSVKWNFFFQFWLLHFFANFSNNSIFLKILLEFVVSNFETLWNRLRRISYSFFLILDKILLFFVFHSSHYKFRNKNTVSSRNRKRSSEFYSTFPYNFVTKLKRQFFHIILLIVYNCFSCLENWTTQFPRRISYENISRKYVDRILVAHLPFNYSL